MDATDRKRISDIESMNAVRHFDTDAKDDITWLISKLREVSESKTATIVDALNDGQEVKLFKSMGPEDHYVVQITGDCYLDAQSKELPEAIKEAAEKYEKWSTEVD